MSLLFFLRSLNFQFNSRRSKRIALNDFNFITYKKTTSNICRIRGDNSYISGTGTEKKGKTMYYLVSKISFKGFFEIVICHYIFSMSKVNILYSFT